MGLDDGQRKSRKSPLRLVIVIGGILVTEAVVIIGAMMFLSGPPEVHAILEIASTFPRPFAKQLLCTLEAMRVTASYYAELWRREQESGAEERAPTGQSDDRTAH